MIAEWIPLTEAAGMVTAALFRDVKGVTPTARRAYATQHLAESLEMIERLWRHGSIMFRAGRIETLDDGGSIVVAVDQEIDPRTLDDAFFHEPDVLRERGSRRNSQGHWEDIVTFKATEISVSRPDLEEWLAHFAAKDEALHPASKPSVLGTTKAPPSVEVLTAYLLDRADGKRTQAELKRMAEAHFGCTIPDKNRWRPAWTQLDDGQKLAQGAKPPKYGN
ncbi:hypothetical protein NKI12_28740 [Mesorhizobium australicum]|uniref:Uncharacterized protein n=1 Tax=Mesorhizobium australicum TaxID=536018 RepID=A0ACC6T776_9HYPH